MTKNKIIDGLKNKYKNSMSDSKIEEIFNNAKDIVNKSIANNEPSNSSGLLLGKIQSGKTSNFIAVIGEALSGIYNLVIVFSGKDDVLYTQNYKRIKKNFLGIEGVEVLSLDDASGDYRRILRMINNNQKIIITCLKESKRFKQLNDFIIKFKNDSLNKNNINTMFIDDEGDQGSLDGNANTKKKEATAWNEQINILRSTCKPFAFLTVTATPYANMLIEATDSLSPKFINLSYPGEGYMGLEYFHNENDSNDVLIKINAEEEKRIHSDHDFSKGMLPDSLKVAISHFVISSCLLEIESNSLVSTNMLVHIQRKVVAHAIIKESINQFIDMQYKFSNTSPTNFNYKKFLDFFSLGYRLVFKKEPDFKNVETNNLLEKFYIKLTSVLNVRSINRPSKKENKNYLNSDDDEYRCEILIGADLLERGVTIKNLLTTYFVRMVKNKINADTLHQRARWMGYRQNIKKYIKVFIGESSIKQFRQIRQIENQLWSLLEDLNNNISIKEFIENPILTFVAESEAKFVKINATRKNVAAVKTNKKTFGLIYQKKAKESLENERNFFDETISSNLQTQPFPINRELYYRDFQDINDFFNQSKIKKNIFVNLNLKENDYISNELLKMKNNVRVYFFFESKGNNLTRTVYRDGKNINMFVGQAENVNFDDEATWFGQKNLHKYKVNKDKIIIQIHRFKYEFENDEDEEGLEGLNFAYSLYIPYKEGYSVYQIGRRSNI